MVFRVNWRSLSLLNGERWVFSTICCTNSPRVWTFPFSCYYHYNPSVSPSILSSFCRLLFVVMSLSCPPQSVCTSPLHVRSRTVLLHVSDSVTIVIPLIHVVVCFHAHVFLQLSDLSVPRMYVFSSRTCQNILSKALLLCFHWDLRCIGTLGIIGVWV